MEMFLIGLLVIVVFGAGYVIGLFNSLIRRRNESDNALSQIDVQLKRRYDLIPNLVESVKAYLKHERETLEAVIAARNVAHQTWKQAQAQDSSTDLATAFASESGLSGALGRLFALNENYPELKADAQVRELMEELKSTENRIAFARQHYNDVTTDYNASLQSFPEMFIAGYFRWPTKDLWKDITPLERLAPEVKF